MKKISQLLILIIFGSFYSYSQNKTATGRDGESRNASWDSSYVHGSDTLYYTFPAVRIYSVMRKFDNKKDQKRYDKLVYHIKKVYPYAKKAAQVLKEEEAYMAGFDKSERKAHMKKVEKRIEREFGGELKSLTFTQGRILLKLIDRETGYTSYELVDELRGSFRAWFYDGIASLFNYDLKSEFDTHNNLEDRYIDEVVRLIEAGQISLK
jgi:hypothetical protein